VALETFNYLDSLVPTNPVVADGLVNGDDHIRGIKSTLKATFPNITGVVTATQDALNSAAVQATTGTALFADIVRYASHSVDAVVYSAPGVLTWYLNGTAAATWNNTAGGQTNFAFHGPVTFDGAITGPGVIPIGGMIMWLEDTLPSVGTWCWANGGTLSRTTYAALFARWGTTYGAGDGATTFNVINMQEVAPVGKSTMGGAASPGLLASIATGVKNVLNGLFGSDTRTLVTANLPPYTPAGTIANGAITIAQDALKQNNGSTTGGGGFGIPSSGPAATITATQAPSTFNGQAQGGSSAAFGIAQPSRAVNFIIRIA
jgi:microcystin-dependent protein